MNDDEPVEAPAATAPEEEPESWLAEQVRLLAVEEGLGP